MRLKIENIKFIWLLLTSPFLLTSQTIGFIQSQPGHNTGYILFAPLHSRTTYLIDKCGRQVHSWKSKYKPGQSAYLLPDGNLLRCGNDSNTAFISGGGVIEKLNWNSEVVWSYAISTPTSCFHHDVCPLPNGNVLAIVWEKKTPDEIKKLGRKADAIGKSIWMEKIVELKPKGKNGATVVWEWKVWDHLVQDLNSTLPNYGAVADNPQLININYKATAEEDWLHFNSLAYNATLDQILISNRNLNEIYIIDHSTTAKQAASHTGGRYKKGGDLLYRWGNAAAYNTGNENDQRLFWQHSAHWIAKGLKDQGKIMIFNNGTGRSVPEPYSSVEIIDQPVKVDGSYLLEPKKPSLPMHIFWLFRDSVPEIFYSKNVSNAQRLSNGNTLICEGASGKFFEITPERNRVWKYINPVGVRGVEQQGNSALENPVFRCLFYTLDYSGFKGKKLAPGAPIEINPMDTGCETGL